MHCARQFVISEKIRQITVPAGLKEQIISEQAAQRRSLNRQSRLLLAATAAVALLVILAPFWIPHHPKDDALVIYQNQMVNVALRGYGMDLLTNNPVEIRSYLAKNHAPSDYVLPAALEKAAVAGVVGT